MALLSMKQMAKSLLISHVSKLNTFNQHQYQNQTKSLKQTPRLMFESQILQRVLDYFEDTPAPRDHWMTMPEMGYIIATCYGVTVIHLCRSFCLTCLPLYAHSEAHQDVELHEICIGYTCPRAILYHIFQMIGIKMPTHMTHMVGTLDIKIALRSSSELMHHI